MTKYEYKTVLSTNYIKVDDKLNELGKEGFRIVATSGECVILERPTVESFTPVQHDPKKEFLTQFMSAGIDCELQEDGSVIIKLENSNYQTDIKFRFNANGVLSNVEHRSRIIPK